MFRDTNSSGISFLYVSFLEWKVCACSNMSVWCASPIKRQSVRCKMENILLIVHSWRTLLNKKCLKGRTLLTIQVCVFVTNLDMSFSWPSRFFFIHFLLQDFAIQDVPSAKKILHVETVDVEETGQTLKSYDHEEKNVPEKLAWNKPGSRNKKLEPSLKWKNLGLTSFYEWVIIPNPSGLSKNHHSMNIRGHRH